MNTAASHSITENFRIGNRSGLVDSAFVCFVRGCDSDRVSALVDSGDLKFVFDVAENKKPQGRGGKIRELRFWVNEVLAPQMTAGLSIEELIEKLLPVSRKTFGTTEVRQLLLVSRVKGARICRQMNGTLQPGGFRVTRAALVEFLREKWISGESLQNAPGRFAASRHSGNALRRHSQSINGVLTASTNEVKPS